MTEQITVRRELLRQVRDLLTFMQEWVDAVPADAQLPAMPGFDGDWAAGVKADLRAALEQPSQKPKLRVGQFWLMRGGVVVEIKSKTTNPYLPFRCVLAGRAWDVRADGRYCPDFDTPYDLIELISDVPQKPELRVGQIWRTRGGRNAIIESVTYRGFMGYPVLAKFDDWYERTYTLDGRFTKAREHPADLIELISDALPEGGN